MHQHKNFSLQTQKTSGMASASLQTLAQDKTSLHFSDLSIIRNNCLAHRRPTQDRERELSLEVTGQDSSVEDLRAMIDAPGQQTRVSEVPAQA